MFLLIESLINILLGLDENILAKITDTDLLLLRRDFHHAYLQYNKNTDPIEIYSKMVNRVYEPPAITTQKYLDTDSGLSKDDINFFNKNLKILKFYYALYKLS
nr:unnamed protein product [Meloidogyne enterolobii]